MNADQLARSAWIFEEALSLQGLALAEFLDRECAGDAEVRAEVVRLLHLHPGVTQSFLEAPAAEWADPAELDRGQRVGRYEIQEKLGAGGMSVVYRAVDTGIGRQVALKLIRPTDASSGDSTKRFFGELRMLGALQLECRSRI
jgi:eukaryotic-like serine/threonine-protein kinase